ncbi:HNH endonuclease [Luteimonas terrae]|uniref:HNH endonuclease n=1 Tax=Luteimonas terrae TaxID=1530191 RepID=A0A4V3ANW7_9GAMM|nr:HNH endonuclease [Luteimonas terrae]TDK33212.1 HNH endonuclease [Luteimonas terrae]
MLWHEDMTEIDGLIRYRQDWRAVIAELEATRPMTAKRADNFLKHVSNLKVGSLVRVGIVEGSRAKSSDDESSRVAKRMLDPEFWHLSYWDPITSTYEFARGLPSKITPEGSPSQSESEVLSGLTKADALEIHQDIESVLVQDITVTEKQRLISARLGQGKFRSEVLERWHRSCAVTGSTTLDVIRASHSKPWRSCTNEERLDPSNGLPLVATLDALFDAGLITFNDNGDLLVSPRLQDDTLKVDGLKLVRALTASERIFLDYHRREIYKS